MLMLFLFSFNFVSCDNEELTDKVETIKIYVSAETDTYIPWGSDTPVECMLVKEEGSSSYEKGNEYTLKVEKRTLANPPADDSKVRYKLIEIISEQSN